MELVVKDIKNTRVNITWESPVILLTSKNVSVLNDFTEAILKDREQCFILEPNQSKLHSLAEYSVDFFDDKFARTSLSIEEYLSFFGLTNRIFSNSFIKDMEYFLRINHLQEFKDESICNLSIMSQLKTRLFITIKRNARLLVISNNTGSIKDSDLIEIMDYVQNFCKQYNLVAIITTRSTPLIGAYKGEIVLL